MARTTPDRERVVQSLQGALEGRPEIVLALLHGSFLAAGAYRDIDVAVWLDPGSLSREERFRYAVDLSVHLHLRLGAPIDVRVLNDAPLAFRYHALQTNSAKYLPIVAIEAALDIGNHLAARRGARSPEDYADCMAIMAEIGVVDADLRTRLMRMARFRNLLVHLYARVDDGEVHRVVREDLGDLERYLTSVGRYLEAEI